MELQSLKNKVSVLIPTHKRHRYLERILSYYNSQGIAVVIADSTPQPYVKPLPAKLSITYHHLPALSLTQKIEYCLERISTPFVVMCADDDFTLPEAIADCVSFLIQNPDYAAVQKNMLIYGKQKAKSGAIEFSVFYKNISSITLEAAEPMARMASLLANYKSFFYAVHSTENLREAFAGAGDVIQNLYLNEYLTALPIAKGAYAEVPGLFQVREFAEDSDDKVTDNIDKFFFDEKERALVDAYLSFMATKISPFTTQTPEQVRDALREMFGAFAKSIAKNNKRSVKKKIGNVVAKFPFVGRVAIQLNRRLEGMKKEVLPVVVQSAAEQAELERIRAAIAAHPQTFDQHQQG